MPQIDYSQQQNLLPKEPAFFSSQIESARRFTLDLKPPRRVPMVVVCGGVERCAANFEIDRPTFEYFCIEFVVAGRGELTLNGKAHQLGPGDLFVYGPNIPHRISSNSAEPLVKYFVDFSGTRCKEVLTENGLEPGSIVQTSVPDQIMRLFDELISAGQRRGPRCGSICALLVEQMILRTFETLIPVKSLGSKAFTTFTSCYRYIIEHHLEISDIREVADACDVDVSYMCRLFQRFSRQSAYSLLARERMAVAAKALGEEGTLVKQVAEQMGFSDPFHFSRAFRRVYGISPLQFQRLFKNRM